MEGDAGSGQLTPIPPLTSDATAADEAAETDTGISAPASRLAEGRWFTGVCAAIAIAALVLAIGGVFALLGHHRTAAAINGEAAAVAAAKECVAATQAPDVKAMKESQRKIVDCATETFMPQATLYSGILTDAYQAVNAQVKVDDMRAAVEKHNPDGSIDVLVATRVSMANAAEPEQTLSYRLRVRMAPVDGTYKIDAIEPVSK